jgi:hypothetical protein
MCVKNKIIKFDYLITIAIAIDENNWSIIMHLYMFIYMGYSKEMDRLSFDLKDCNLGYWINEHHFFVDLRKYWFYQGIHVTFLKQFHRNFSLFVR